MIIKILYLLFSFCAIGALAFWLHRLGQSALWRFSGEPDVRAAWLAEFPDDPIKQITLAPNGHGALVQLADCRVGLVRAMGKFFVAKKCDAKLLKQIVRQGSTLHFHFVDFTDPLYELTLLDEPIAIQWYAYLEEHHDA